MTKTNKYQMNEKDIDTALRFLKTTDPKHANSKTAIELLEHLSATFHNMQHENPQTLSKIYEDLKKQKELSRN